MSRFFAAGSSSSEHDSESESFLSDEELNMKSKLSDNRKGLFESLSYSEEEEDSSEGDFDEESEEEQDEDMREGGKEAPAAPVRKSRFDFSSDDESSEEESTQRHVKSQKEKAKDEMNSLVDSIEDALDAIDWVAVQEHFDRLMKLIAKYKGICVPYLAYVVLSTIDVKIVKFGAGEEVKALNATAAKTFNALRQKIKKAIVLYSAEIERAEQVLEDGGEDEDDGASIGGSILTGTGTLDSTVKVTELTPETLLKRLQEIISMRGRKHVDKNENVAALRKMLEMTQNRRYLSHILAALVIYSLEVSSSNLGYIPTDAFQILLNDLAQLNSTMMEECSTSETSQLIDLTPEEEEVGLPLMSALRSTMISYAQRVDDEFTKALQNIDPHSSEYVEFLRMEPQLFSCLEKCRLVLFPVADQSELYCQIAVRQLDHLYHRPAEVVQKYFSANSPVTFYCREVYEKGIEKQKLRALLYHIYWLAIHDNYVKARDLMLYSHVQENLSSMEINMQILYNRTLVQVGLAAFRSGHLKETYFALQEICSTGRPKELLAQGMVGQKYTEKSEMDRLERQRLIPFHMQINVELIDCVFLTVSMLLEIPQNAAASRRYFSGERKLFQSRHLRRILDVHERNLFNGPPENTREFVIASTKALANGDWKLCEELLMQIKIWNHLPHSGAIKNMLCHKIREAGLYSFLYSVGSTFESLSVEKLSKEYDLPMNLVVRIVTALTSEFGVPATLTEDSLYLKWNAYSDPTPTQEILMQLKDKILSLEERNNTAAELITFIHNTQASIQRNQEIIKDQVDNYAKNKDSVPIVDSTA